jgi:hypothetical protein
MKIQLNQKKSLSGVKIVNVQTKAIINLNITSKDATKKKEGINLFYELPVKEIDGVKFIDL